MAKNYGINRENMRAPSEKDVKTREPGWRIYALLITAGVAAAPYIFATADIAGDRWLGVNDEYYENLVRKWEFLPGIRYLFAGQNRFNAPLLK